MRSNGIDEKYVTGDSTDWEKFKAWAETMPKLIGNPLYHWSHLELRKYFGYQGFLNSDKMCIRDSLYPIKDFLIILK